MDLPSTSDFVVIGGGVIGLCVASELKTRYPDCQVTLIEKETDFGAHASGRNSGVLHAGFYYTADSLKARFTREGNRKLTQYCFDRGLAINRCGKLVVARDESELAALDELHRRARCNGVEVEMLSEAEARTIEPRVKTVARALFSPTTASVDPRRVVASLVEDARRSGITLVAGTAYQAHKGGTVLTSRGPIGAGYVVNAAGLYADAIAREYGFGHDYTILPFKGLYLKSSEPTGALKTNIYPVPNLDYPFLGVHLTVAVDGRVKLGPTAIPAFWREQYAWHSNFSLRECVNIVGLEASLLLRNRFGFARLAFQEMQKYYKPRMIQFASGLAKDMHPDRFGAWGPPGIRAQLVNVREGKLEMDFRYEADGGSCHVLNAVSPAFTCCMPFGAYLVDAIEQLINEPKRGVEARPLAAESSNLFGAANGGSTG